MKARFVAVPHPTRKGYTVKDTTGKAKWMTGPGRTAGWYKLKRDAQARADEFNYSDRTGVVHGLGLLPGVPLVPIAVGIIGYLVGKGSR